MIKHKELVPKRRFEGFDGKWNTKVLDELGSFGKTYAFSRANEGYGLYNHVHYGDIHVKYNGLIKQDTKVPSLKVKGDFETLKKNDIVIADASEDYLDLGKTVIVEDLDNRKLIAGLHTFKFTPSEHLDAKYYLYYSQSELFKKFSYKKGTGISVFGISKVNMGKMKLNIPLKNEQQKIGEFFKHFDEMIALEQRKIDKTKALKSAYLAEMFPAEGERVPKRRFAGFTDDWEKRTINEISLNILAGGDIDRSKISDKGKYPVLANALTNDGIVGYYQNEYRVKAPAITVTGRGEVGHAQVREVDFTPVVRLLSIKTNHDVYFLEHSINNYRGFFESTGVPQLTVPKLGDYEIYFPSSLKEEYLIGRYFKKIDSIIKTHDQKLEKLKATKQAYLHEMFV